MATTWTPADSSLFFSKKDLNDPRLGDCTTSLTDTLKNISADLALWGYPDHEGIKLNGGRLGAAEAPRAIRTVFYKMTPHVLHPQAPRIVDGGDISLHLSLSDRHEAGARRSYSMTEMEIPWVSLGGGHDYGYADGAGFLRACIAKKNRPLVLNFDAHLDVRPTDRGLSSGTPFFRLLNEFKGDFDFFEIGLQGHCNSRVHWDWALEQGAQLISYNDIQKKGLLSLLQQKLAPHKGQTVWVSFDMDAMTSVEAPGCSQSWTTGLVTTQVMDCFDWLYREFKWKSFSIYEVSPPLDSDLRTAKLAAQFLHHFLTLQLGMKS